MRGLALWLGGIAVVASLAAGTYWIRETRLEAAILRADPDRLAGDSELRAFALLLAAPTYRSHCAACHGDRLQGDQERGIPRLGRHRWLYGTGLVSEIERTILYGIRSGNPKGWSLAVMPAFARAVPSASQRLQPLSPPEIRDLAAYLRRLNGLESDSAAADRGRETYGGRGGCYDCHGTDAKGDSAIGAPDLADGEWLYDTGTERAVYESIAQGHAGVCPFWIGRLRPAVIRALALYVSPDAGPER